MISDIKKKINAQMKVPKRLRVGSHEVEEEVLLSEGGYGYIWKVRDTRSGEYYAMKKMICMDREKLQVAKNEISVLQALNPHPNVVNFIDSEVCDQGNGTYHVLVLLELCEGGTLVDLLGKYEHNHLKEGQIIQILKQVCSALKKMHTQSPPIAHRDIKIENILLNQRQFKICDFGSCSRKHVDLRQIPKSEYAALEEEYDKNTTLMYRPPEMCDLYQQHVVNEKVDVWMLGCALYVICFYKHPFAEASKLSIVNAAFQIPENQEYSEKMKDFIRLMLTPNPAYRPDIHAVIRILDNYDNLSGIELNKQAQDLKAHQKKQAASDDVKTFKSYQGDIPMDELLRISQSVKKDDDDYGYAPKKKTYGGGVSNSKPTNTRPTPAPQQNFAPESMDFGAWGVQAAPKPQQQATSNADFWGNFDAPKAVPVQQQSNDFMSGWGNSTGGNNSGGGDFGWGTPAPQPIKTAPAPAPVQKAVSNTFDNMWGSPAGNDTSKSTPSGHTNDNLWGGAQVWSSNTGSQVPVHKPQAVVQTDNLLDLAAPPPKLDSKGLQSLMSDIKF